MQLLLPWLLAASVAHAGDRDRDGIKGKADACPEQAEALNGYRDGDGCPDELGQVTVSVLDLEGRPLGGARVRLGSERGTTEADGVVRFRDRMPETVVELAVSREGYVENALPDFEIPEGELTEVVVLDWVPAPVAISAIDAASRLPMDAAVRWDGPGHIETERTGEDGEVVFDVRPGTWRVRVEADHYQGAETTLDVTREGAPAQRLALVPNWMRIEERWIPFPEGSAALPPDQVAEVEALAGDLFGFPDVSVTIEGHADAADDALSARRAEAVAEALRAAGVAAGRVEVRDLGDRVPFDTPWTPEGRAANRAVRFRWVDEGGAPDPTGGLAIPFDEDGATPPAELAARLRPLVEALARHPAATVQVEGHRDPAEGALSLERARAVAAKLLERGVPDERLFAVGRRAVDGLDSGVGFRLRSGAETVELPHEIYFEPGSEMVEAMSVVPLREAARLLVKHPVMRVAVRGHARAELVEDAARLARARAAEVAGFLRREGVAAERIVERGFPDEGAEVGDPRARRVDFVILPPPLLSTERLRYDPGVTELDDTAEPALRRVLEALAAHEGVRLRVVGAGIPADGGPAEVVGKLRATRVRDRLVALGVAASRVEADGEAGTGGEGAVRFEVAGLTVAEALRFGPRSSEVDAEARAVLDELVSTLLLAPATVRVVGFAGASDGRVVLDELARARADAVADYLAYAGLDRARLRVSAEVDPRGDAASRRVELRAGR